MNAPVGKNALVTVQMPWLAMNQDEVIEALRNSIYPGAQIPSIKMVMGYCQAQNLDPFQKPVHIVPMSVTMKEPDKNDANKVVERKVYRDVIMPGVGLYRITAHRTNECAGIDEPVFGPTKTIEWTEEGEDEFGARTKRTQSIEYPEWCSVTVHRMKDGKLVAFTAKEFWLENYATTKPGSKVPNAMWRKRPFGQIGKCAQAQALRIGFPEVGSQPTAEEMAGKTIDDLHDGVTVDAETGEITGKPPASTSGVQMPTRKKPEPKPEQKPEAPSSQSVQAEEAPHVATESTAGEEGGGDLPGFEQTRDAAATSAPGSSEPARPNQKQLVAGKMKIVAVNDVDLSSRFGFTVETMPANKVNAVMTWLNEKLGK